MYDKVREQCGGDVLLPIMITCDPARDSPKVLKEYLKEFHPDIVGLTGEYENIKQTWEKARVRRAEVWTGMRSVDGAALRALATPEMLFDISIVKPRLAARGLFRRYTDGMEWRCWRAVLLGSSW